MKGRNDEMAGTNWMSKIQCGIWASVRVSLYYSDFELHLFHVTSSPSSVFNTNDNCNVIIVCECQFLKLTIKLPGKFLRRAYLVEV